jgi:hypothetical protein
MRSEVHAMAATVFVCAAVSISQASAYPSIVGSIHEREWQAVMEVLLSAVEGREPVSLLRIALTLALQESER